MGHFVTELWAGLSVLWAKGGSEDGADGCCDTQGQAD